MMNDLLKKIKERIIEEEERLHPLACKSVDGKRDRQEKPSPVRTEFQRDRDRIIHSKSFRRLKHKTQVFISPEGDHLRTRLTHTLEVSQIARTIAKALNLNEELTEAIALGHDLGHTPFGHIGERVLDKLYRPGFKHYFQSLRVVEKLEYNGKGLNLTDKVRDGIVKHSKGMGPIIPDDKSKLPQTLEGQIVRISDIIAYVNHDLDDSIRSGIISEDDIPDSTKIKLGKTYAKRIDTVVINVITSTMENDYRYINIDDEIYNELLVLRDFLNQRVYKRTSIKINGKSQEDEIEEVITTLYEYLLKNHEGCIHNYPKEDDVETRVVDFIAGMTDRYAINLYEKIINKNILKKNNLI